MNRTFLEASENQAFAIGRKPFCAALEPVYEDNHIIIINKRAGEIVQADKTGDRCLLDDVKAFLKDRDEKPGNVFLAPVHRIDRPTTGLVIFAKTSKGLSRFSEMFRKNAIAKTYLAITDGTLGTDEGEISDWLAKDEEKNKSFAVAPGRPGAKLARLAYRRLADSDSFHLYQVTLYTGRHHQIRAQFASRGVHIKGDVKYGARRPNADAGISLHAFSLSFRHPVNGRAVRVSCWPVTGCESEERIWEFFKEEMLKNSSFAL